MLHYNTPHKTELSARPKTVRNASSLHPEKCTGDERTLKKQKNNISHTHKHPCNHKRHVQTRLTTPLIDGMFDSSDCLGQQLSKVPFLKRDTAVLTNAGRRHFSGAETNLYIHKTSFDNAKAGRPTTTLNARPHRVQQKHARTTMLPQIRVSDHGIR